jgi:alpha-1,3-mannosyltransferase
MVDQNGSDVAVDRTANIASSAKSFKVTHIVRQFRPAVGGLEESVHRLCKLLAEQVNIEIITLDRLFTHPTTKLPASEIIDGLQVTRLPWFGSRRYPIAPGIWRAIRDADIVHVHAIDFFFDGLAATRFLHGKPLVASTHGGFFHTNFAGTLKKAYFNTVTRANIQAYDAICASGDSDQAIFSKISKRVHPVGNGVQIDKWAGRARPNAGRTLIYFGRISRNKRVDLALLLLKQLRADHEDWRLIIAGSPWDVSEKMLRDDIARHGLDAHVDLVLSPDDEGIGRLIDESTFYVSASEHEGFGISVVEAMGAGLYPILSRIPAFEAFTVAGGVGHLIDDFSTVQAADAVRNAFDAMTADSAQVRNRLMRLAAKYGWRERADEVLEIYRKIRLRTPRGAA